MYIHLSAVAYSFVLAPRRTAAYAWRALREAFPTAIAVCLMGNHLHLVVWSDDPEATRLKLAAVICGITRYAGLHGPNWKPVELPEPLADVKKLELQVRYVALNPCRADIASDPLAWPWSTHRDAVGAVRDPWVSAARLAQALKKPEAGFAAAHHAFVSDDKHVKIGGTPPPLAEPARPIATLPLASIAAAACAAIREPLASIGHPGLARQTFIQLAIEQGWVAPRFLAPVCGASPKTVWRLAQNRDEAALAAARLCLGDARLRLGLDQGAAPDPTHVPREKTSQKSEDGQASPSF